MATRFLQLVCCVLTALHTTALSIDDALRLRNALKTTKLPPDIRPVKNNTMRIYYGLTLLNIESLDEVKGILHLNLWARYLWQDAYMTWKPSDYNGIHVLRRPLTDVWQPDLTVFNQRGQTVIQPVLGQVYSDGTVLYTPPMQTKTSCELDLTYYPFDIQTCGLMIASWTHDGTAIDVDLFNGQETIDLSEYIHNAEWDILKTTAKKTVVYYACCNEPYPDVSFNLTIQRKVSYYTYVYLGPAIILSLLVPFIFLLPPGDQQKITLGVGILICFTLFFLELSTQIPMMHTHTPLIHKYYMATYVLVAMSVAMSTLVSNLIERNHTPRHPSKFLTKVMLGCIGRCMCVQYCDTEHPTDAKMEAEDKAKKQATQWQMVATVMDRLLFLAFLVLSVLVALCILTIRPPWDYSTQSWVPTAKRPPGAVAPLHVSNTGH